MDLRSQNAGFQESSFPEMFYLLGTFPPFPLLGTVSSSMSRKETIDN